MSKHPTALTDQEKLSLSEALLRDDCTLEMRKAASDLIVLGVVQRNDVLRALGLR